MKPQTILIVGGGITGLTAAYYIKKDIEQHALPYQVKVLEASDRLGGKIHTFHQDGFVIERGGDSFLERKTPAVELVNELGLQAETVRNSTGQAYILVEDRLHPIPAGSHMGIPLHEDVLANSDLLSAQAKERVFEDVTLPKSEPATDQSLGHFLRSRFGDELVENIIEPLLSGIYSSDMDEMSLMAAFPHFYQLEQEYGSLIQGLRETLPTAQKSTGKRKGQFLSFKKGLDTLLQALTEAIGEENIIKNANVHEIHSTTNGYEVVLTDGTVYQPNALLLTIPHSKIPPLMPQEPVWEKLKNVPMSSVANIVLAFDEDDIGGDLEGTGFVVSRNSPFRITACTWTSRKWPATAPAGRVLLRAYVGKPTDQEIVKLPDDEIEQIVLHELSQMMTIKGNPLFSVVTRWQEQMPQYNVGHPATVQQLEENLRDRFPGMYIAGASYYGVGIPDCIEQGKERASSIIDYLQQF
ncbi:MAG TPA: protoporphyrinogen oxidase [Pseudogracilibacillus sp.]|nr:protoporphyrinogen oxidase [Pseudogracilibacillus sp.]